MNEILSEIRALRQERLAEIDTDDDEEEEEEETPTSIIAGILKEPEMKAAILGLVANIATGLIKPAPVKQIAGVETDSIQKSIEILLSKGVTEEDIAKLAAMEQGQINFLLSMLRK